MAKTVFIFFTNCKDPARAKELGDWYDNIHIPDVESVPGVRSCIRYRVADHQLAEEAKRPDGGVPTYISIVESEDDAELAIARLREGIAKWEKANRMVDLFEITSMATYTQLNPPAA